MNYELLKSKALVKGIKEIELYTKVDNKLSISVFDDEVSEKTESETKVYAIRGVYNNQLVTVYTEKDTEDEIDYIIDKIITNAKYLNSDDPFFIYGGDKEYHKLPKKEYPFLIQSTKDKVDFLLAMTSLMKEKTDKYFHGEAEYSEYTTKVLIENSNGLNVSNEYSYAVIVCEVSVKDGNDIKMDFKFDFINDLKEINLDSYVSEVVEEALSKFGAKSLPSKAYKVVLQNNVVASLMSAFISNFYATQVKRKMSFLDNLLDKEVFGKNITLVDDPFNSLSPIHTSFDDEGVATSYHEIVKNGVLKTYFHNLSTAKYYNTKSTGNGFKAGVSSPVTIEPTNFMLLPGDKSFDELLAQVGEGILITSVTGLHAGVNPVSGDFNLQCSGYAIKDGKKDKAVTLIVLSGKFQDMLNNVVEIGNDLKYRGNMIMPSIYIKEMNISGV